MKGHTPGPTDHDPDQIGAVGRWHEIDHRRTARLSLKFSLEDQRAGAIAPTYINNRLFRGDDPSSIISRSKQTSKARSRVETGPAQPIDRAVAADQSGCLAIADQRIVFDSKRHYFRSPSVAPTRARRKQDRK